MAIEEVIIPAQILWDFLHMNQPLHKADCILALGSHDVRVAHRSAELFLQDWAPLLIFSGGLGRLTSGAWSQTEAEKFAAIAMQRGVPAQSILIENRSTNTGDNILFSRALLKEKGVDPESFILVQKPYAERRTFATFKKLWPEKRVLVTSQRITFEEYPNDEIPLEKVIDIMVGDLQRIKVYPAKGFQVYQRIPDKVWKAYEELVRLGFTRQLVKE
jgi:uncharacterized SAM-binding protein YcdF (DUF218 family)